MIKQFTIDLTAKSRGFHLIDDEIGAYLESLPKEGLCNIFCQHTSCALSINENCDPSVRDDFETSINHLVKESEDFYTHTQEGIDDMPAHIKSSLFGVSLTIPIINGKLALGTWQGIYLCEFRNKASKRKIVLTIYS